MGRRPRILVAGGIYHVYNRVSRVQHVFRKEAEAARLEDIFAQRCSGATDNSLTSSQLLGRQLVRLLSVAPNELPGHLGRILRRCLEKDLDRRYQTALDLRNELENLRDETVPAG